MATVKTIIKNRLKNLEEIPGVTVTTSGSLIRIAHNRHHAMAFQFKWIDDHYTGYFEDGQGGVSQAVVSIRNGLQAMEFAAAFRLLEGIRAKKKS